MPEVNFADGPVASTWCLFGAPNLDLVLACSAAIRLTPPILVLELGCPTLVTPVLQPQIHVSAEPTVEYIITTDPPCATIAYAFPSRRRSSSTIANHGFGTRIAGINGTFCITFAVQDRILLSIGY